MFTYSSFAALIPNYCGTGFRILILSVHKFLGFLLDAIIEVTLDCIQKDDYDVTTKDYSHECSIHTDSFVCSGCSTEGRKSFVQRTQDLGAFAYRVH